MRKTKIRKRLLSAITALAMVASASAASISTLTTYAGEMLGEGTFNDGVGLPWHICENGTGEMGFELSDGVYNIVIKNPGGTGNGGEDRWDCQFRHRGLTMVWGHTYRLTFSMYATNAGKLYAKIGDITNDDLEFWHGNGTKLSMTYSADMTQAEVESALKSASSTGTYVEYYMWDGWCSATAKTWVTYAFEFTLNKSDIQNTTAPDTMEGTCEWTFHMGGTGTYTSEECFPAGTIIKFDNLVLIDMTSDDNDYIEEEDYEVRGIELNQVGYYPNLSKVATLMVDEGDSSAKTFTVKDSSGNVVYTGTTTSYGYDSDGAWSYYQLIDFSDLTTEGEGYTIECDGKTSLSFDISNDIYSNLLTQAINYYYLNRSGVDIEADYIVSSGQNDDVSALARSAGHVTSVSGASGDIAYITDEWVRIYSSDPTANGTGTYTTTIDVTGGWYDAGDYGKYVVNGGLSVWTLANIYERSLANGDTSKWDDAGQTVVIPEAGNGIPDILDELIWECDFFLTMQRDDGMVYHKVHDYKWTALGVMPYLSDSDSEKQDTVYPSRIVKPATYAATLNAAAAWAQVARLLEDYDSAKAAEYLTAAEKAYAAAKSYYVANYGDIYADVEGDSTVDTMFAPIEDGKGGGAYGDTCVADEFYWASCELYITTGSSTYYSDLSAYDEAFEVVTALYGGENDGTFSSWTWGTLASLGTISLYLNEDCISTSEAKTIEDSIIAAGDAYVEQEESSGYGIPYHGMAQSTYITKFSGDTYEDVYTEYDGYEWGSNSMVINNAIVMAYAYDVTGDTTYINGVSTAMDYLLGRNPLEQSYITGYGEHCTENPHHRYWCHQLNSSFPYAPDGVLSGGPNSTMNDPMIMGAGYKIGELAPMLCYYDQVEAWSVNEITINWNAPLVWVASFLDDEAPLVDADDDDDDSDVLWGDADVDGDVDVNDVVLASQSVSGASTLTTQGKLNADVDQDGSITLTDALNILRYLAGIVELPVE